MVGTAAFEAAHELTGFQAHGIVNNNNSSGSVWWSWTAPMGGPVNMDTLNSEFSTFPSISTGPSETAQIPITSNMRFNGLWTSHVKFNAEAHRRYHIRVQGNPEYSPRTGNIDLNLYQPGDPDSFLHIYTTVEVELFAKSDQRYQLERSPDFVNWSDAGVPFTGNNEYIRWFFLARPGEKEFFRARKLTP
ncbi:MAG: hypothetical protein EXS36_11870 [Pedosphaera sp.]|nr:hypothetical protein [Pedosphaera sp.]